MDKPPKGKLSTKGLGKTVPLESEHVKWKDEVVVPCGRPVPSSVRASELLYNEYIVYDTAQVCFHFSSHFTLLDILCLPLYIVAVYTELNNFVIANEGTR